MVRVELNGGHFFKRFMIGSSITTTVAQTACKHCGHITFSVTGEQTKPGSVIRCVTEAFRKEKKVENVCMEPDVAAASHCPLAALRGIDRHSSPAVRPIRVATPPPPFRSESARALTGGMETGGRKITRSKYFHT